jgi:hypothetical protein
MVAGIKWLESETEKSIFPRGGCRRGYTHFVKGLFSSDESEMPELGGNGLISVAINVYAECK